MANQQSRRRPSHRDRLSALPDATLARVLCHLPSAEAACTSALSRRWRRVHYTATVVHLVDPRRGNDRQRIEPEVCFDQQVTSAILDKFSATPIRILRLAVLWPPQGLLAQWVMVAVTSGLEEFDVKLRYYHVSSRALCPFGVSPNASADFDQMIQNMFLKTPPQLLRCGTLRCLRLTNWTLDAPPSGVSLPSLQTLVLKRIMAPRGAVHVLISQCPRLADLTLEECPTATEVTVRSSHLHTFAVVCCHNARRVTLLTSTLRSLRYKGSLPGKDFFAVADYTGIAAVAIDICEDLAGRHPSDVATVTKLISRCTNLEFLHLSLRPAMAYLSRMFAPVLHGLPRLQQLSLKGVLENERTLLSVAVLLQNAPFLDVLSLFPDASRPAPTEFYYSDGSESDYDELEKSSNGEAVEYSCMEEDVDDRWMDEAEDDRWMWVQVPDSLCNAPIECFQKLRKVSLRNHMGKHLETILAKYLLSKASVLEEFSVSLCVNIASRSRNNLDRHALRKWLANWRTNLNTRITCK